MQLPRLTKSIFLDQFLFMQLIGVLIGLAFPHFLVWYGFHAEEVMTLDFYLVSQVAGQTVGLISFLLISTVIRPHLKLLSYRMQEIADGLQNKNFDEHSTRCSDGFCQMDVHSNDEIGVSARAYNQMLDALVKSHEVEKVFNRFTQVMSENLDLSRLSEETLGLLIRSTNFEAGMIMVLKQGELELVASQGIFDPDSLLQHDDIQKVVGSGDPKIIKLPKNIELDGVLTHFKPSEVFIEPIEFKGTNLGVLMAATGAMLADDRTEQLAKLFSRSVGLAINNAMIHSKFQKLAAIDGLTSVYNRRFGMERLKEDFSRAIREQTSMAIAMVDIDHFKSVNDTYGHLVGDKVIKLIASIIKKTLRDGDVVVRYGGEEFLLILHGASCSNAYNVCERIRHQVMDTVFKEGNQQVKLTVSTGLMAYPEQPAGDEMEMIHKADQALYQAKETGRNQVIRYGCLMNEAQDKDEQQTELMAANG